LKELVILMDKIFNRDGFQWFIGVVEDRDDPEKIGRCKVRIYGHHSINKDTQPTHDLPWSVPIQPITSAAISGIGSSPIGPLPGTWVVGFYLDGLDMQQPAFFGTIGSSSAPTVFEETPVKAAFVLKDNDDTKKDQSGQTITKENKLSDGTKAIPSLKADSFPIKVGFVQNPNNPEPPEKPSTLPPVIKKSYTPPNAKASGIEFSLNSFGGTGATSADVAITSNKVFEPGGTEPLNGTFGFRYGIFKLASFMPQITEDGTRRPSAKTSPVFSFMTSEFGQPYKGLFKDEIGSDAFNATWRNNGFKIADSGLKSDAKDRLKFAKSQFAYIRKTYTSAVRAQVVRMGGPIINKQFGGKGKEGGFASMHLFSLMLNNALDLGIVGSAEVIVKACEGKSNLSKADIVELVTEYIIQNSDEILSKLPQEEKDTIKVDQLNQREELKKVEIPPATPTSPFGDFGSGSQFGVDMSGTPDEKLVYEGNDPIVYDRINSERIRRGLPAFTRPRPTGEGNKEVRTDYNESVSGGFGQGVVSRK